MDDDGEARWAAAVPKVARSLVRQGRTAAEVREEWGDSSLWGPVADEMEILEARRGFAVLPGGASRHPLAVRIAAIADKHGESAPALVIVPAGQPGRYRG